MVRNGWSVVTHLENILYNGDGVVEGFRLANTDRVIKGLKDYITYGVFVTRSAFRHLT